MTAEVRTLGRWVRLGDLAEIGESGTLELRHLTPGSPVALGPVATTADATGTVTMRPILDLQLTGHVGMLRVVTDEGEGEIEIVPDKTSWDRYAELRRRLEAVWVGLTADPSAPTGLPAAEIDEPPDVAALWEHVAAAVWGICKEPAIHIQAAAGTGRLDRVRNASSVTPQLLRADLLQRPGPTRVTRASDRCAETGMVAETLRLLCRLGERQDGTASAVAAMRSALSTPVLLDQPAGVRKPTHVVRTDTRYRKVWEVRRSLSRRPRLTIEGPGDVRLGVRCLPRLWEYWVFLQVLLAAVKRYGRPVGTDLVALAVWTGSTRVRIDLPAGTTVRFPSGVVVAFEPTIDTRGGAWQHLELVPPPSGHGRHQAFVTPDVVVLRTGEHPEAVVIDAKYVGRHLVDGAAVETHAKYARMRLEGAPVVRKVICAHPHDGLAADWAGYGYRPVWSPDVLADLLPAVRLPPRTPTVVQTQSSPESPSAPASPLRVDRRWLGWADAVELAAATNPRTESQAISALIAALYPSLRAEDRSALYSDLADALQDLLQRCGLARSETRLLPLARPIFDAKGIEVGDHWFRVRAPSPSETGVQQTVPPRLPGQVRRQWPGWAVAVETAAATNPLTESEAAWALVDALYPHLRVGGLCAQYSDLGDALNKLLDRCGLDRSKIRLLTLVRRAFDTKGIETGDHWFRAQTPRSNKAAD